MATIRHRFLLIFCLGWLVFFGGEVQASSPSLPTKVDIAIFGDGVQVDWHSSEPRLILDELGRVGVTMDGFGSTGAPGVPVLPTQALTLALPPGAVPSLEIQQIESSLLALTGPLALNPRPEGIRYNDLGQPMGGDYVPVTEPVDFDPQVVQLERMGVVRGVQLARLVFYPVLPRGDQLEWVNRVQVRLNYGLTTVSNDIQLLQTDPMLAAVADQVVNPQHLQPVRSAQGDLSAGAARTAAAEAALIEVTTTGITKISYEGLNAAFFPVATVNPLNLKLTHAGVEVALFWSGDWDTVFEPGEYYLFYADPRPSRWVDFDTYVLTEDSSGTRVRVLPQSGDPTGLLLGDATALHFAEENKVYTPDCQCNKSAIGWDGDRWVWNAFTKINADAMSETYTVTLPSVNTSQAGSVKLYLISYTDTVANPDHSISAYLNQSLLTPNVVQWNGKRSLETTLTVPSGGFKVGQNVLNLSLAGLPSVNVEGMWLDAFWVEYVLGANSVGNAVQFQGEADQRRYPITLDHLTNLLAFDISSPTTPKVLTDIDTTGNTVTLGDPGGAAQHTYIITNQDGIQTPQIRLRASLSSQAGGFTGADYVIITHADFAAALPTLVGLRESQGLTVLTEDVQAIYDHFDDGRATPDAIRSFLEAAYQTWSPKPTYVLLVGDGTADPKQYQSNSFNTFIPPYLAEVDPWLGETAADNRYVTVDGDDVLPDMLIGRLPVNSLSEAQTVIAKIVGYETAPPSGDWAARLTFVADDQDDAGDFVSDSNLIADHWVPSQYTTDKVYHADGVAADDTRNAILSSWSAGEVFLTYMGHGSQHTWAHETILHISNIDSLTNAGKLPVVLQMTCYTGQFQVPALDALDEAILRNPAGGAVAVFGPTGLGLSSGHLEITQGFMDSVFHQNQPKLGLAILAGKQAVAAAAPAYTDLIDTFTLLGDPAQVLQLTRLSQIYLPLVLR